MLSEKLLEVSIYTLAEAWNLNLKLEPFKAIHLDRGNLNLETGNLVRFWNFENRF